MILKHSSLPYGTPTFLMSEVLGGNNMNGGALSSIILICLGLIYINAHDESNNINNRVKNSFVFTFAECIHEDKRI